MEKMENERGETDQKMTEHILVQEEKIKRQYCFKSNLT